MKVGILALQGDFLAHGKMFDRLGVPWREVVTSEALKGLKGLVIPGGESTTFLKLLDAEFKSAIRGLVERGGVVYGTCAGAILLARKALNPTQEGMGLLDAVIERNGYGRQGQSFVARPGRDRVEGDEIPSELVFIRAPIFRELGPDVKVLTLAGGLPVYIRQGPIMATTFHPELTTDPSVHMHFLKMMENGATSKRHDEPD
ncbi:MAG: pyridoxal 5'-phosphate synthase glutaminase subunit PdxT [Planctomycetota bacterium]